MHIAKYARWTAVFFMVPATFAQQTSRPDKASEQEVASGTSKYRISIIDGASRFRRARKGWVSSQAVIKRLLKTVTDQNDAPVAGVAVTFSIPQFVGGGAQFLNGSLTALGTTNAAGVASAGFSAGVSGGAFNMAVAAAVVPGQSIAVAIPVNAAAALVGGSAAGAGGSAIGAGGSGAGVSGKVVAVVVAAAAGAVGGAVAAMSGGDATTTTTTTVTPVPPVPVSIGSPAFRPPR